MKYTPSTLEKWLLTLPEYLQIEALNIIANYENGEQFAMDYIDSIISAAKYLSNSIDKELINMIQETSKIDGMSE
jgi:hypothetical protein